MASPLAEAHIEAERRLRVLLTGAVAGIWRGLRGYDERNVDEWLSRVLPLVLAGQRASISLTEAYLARVLERQPLGIDAGSVIREVRAGTTAEEAYRRPFVTLWWKLSEGLLFADASAAALARAQGMAAFDVQAAMARTARTVGEADFRIQRFRRVADANACAFCQALDGSILGSADAMPLHNHCGCGIEPLTEPQAITKPPPDVAIREHDELGPVLADPAHEFTTL